MARPLRIEYAGAVYHITARGDRQEDIYLSDEDHLRWLSVLSQVCERFNWRCHAWCQMTNHYHLVVETVEGNLSKGMRQLNGVYTQDHNRRHKRVGHVFQGRYKAILVDADSYLLELSRYVVLNPLRAGMVRNPGQWRWSSYRSMVGKAEVPDWLETDWLLACFGKQRKRATEKYIEFVKAGKGVDSIWKDLTHPAILGGESFIENVFRKYVDKDEDVLKEIKKLERRPLVKSLSTFFPKAKDRNAGMINAFNSGNFTLKEIGDYCGVHYSTVSRVVNRKSG